MAFAFAASYPRVSLVILSLSSLRRGQTGDHFSAPWSSLEWAEACSCRNDLGFGFQFIACYTPSQLAAFSVVEEPWGLEDFIMIGRWLYNSRDGSIVNLQKKRECEKITWPIWFFWNRLMNKELKNLMCATNLRKFTYSSTICSRLCFLPKIYSKLYLMRI